MRWYSLWVLLRNENFNGMEDQVEMYVFIFASGRAEGGSFKNWNDFNQVMY